MDTNFVASEPKLGDDGLIKRNTPIPPERQGYLAEVASTVRDYHASAQGIAEKFVLYNNCLLLQNGWRKSENSKQRLI